MALGRALPLLLLLAHAVAFGAAAFGASTPAADDHPGQVYRLWHAASRGPAPSAWNPGWWAGYPELQFYPPGFFYVGAALHHATLGTLSITAVYSVLLWTTWLLPGVTVYVALSRLLGSGWLALPGAFVALTLSAGVASGVEGGVRWGMLPARLGWALLPLVPLACARPLAPGGGRRAAAVLAPLVAAIVLVHPAHAPAAVALVALAALVASGDRGRHLAAVLVALALAGALTAFWSVPLLARLEHTRALAWGRLEVPTAPLPLVLLALAALAPTLPGRDGPGRAATGGRGRAAAVALWPAVTVALVAVDAAVLEPLGLRWLPADRIADGAWMAVLLAAGVSGGRLLERLAVARRVPAPALALAAVALCVMLGMPGQALSLWPRPADWPTLEATARGLRLDDLWAALRRAPAGRVLFVRSAVPLVFGPEWWRPHTHVTALAPMLAGRDIVHGTFTHPSPVAALVYRGSAEPGPITTLAERLDGHSLFGVPLATLAPPALEEHADRLGIAVIVVLDEDLPALPVLDRSRTFGRDRTIGPFVLYTRTGPVAVPQQVDARRWRVTVDGGAQGWITTRLTYYPLWRAERDGHALETRRGPAWDLEVKLSGAARSIELVYTNGTLETASALLSAVALLAWLASCWPARADVRPAPPSPRSGFD